MVALSIALIVRPPVVPIVPKDSLWILVIFGCIVYAVALVGPAMSGAREAWVLPVVSLALWIVTAWWWGFF
jgi:hypothetical protein